jgi:Icc-related predicted phosphoesterase
MNKLAAVSEIRGALDRLDRVLGELPARGADAVAVVGDLGAPSTKPEEYRAIFKALGRAGLPVFWVPGATDAPLHRYLPEAFNLEIAFPSLRAVHGTVAFGPGNVAFAGMGGEIVDDPQAVAVEEAPLRYPGWEVEYRLKILRELDDRLHVFLFSTPPAHKGLHEPGSEVLAELIKTYNPRVAVIGGDRAAQLRLGDTLVVCPGRLDRGEYAIVDLDHVHADLRSAEVSEQRS